jgi:2-polyprenyl-6-methoxyphenol hydroxylase-like FAD-dependent oxidoreductase
MSADIADVDVVVIGGGPVGLVSAIQLGGAGVRTLLLERRPTFSVHTKAAGIHARTMEIYRQLGLADTLRRSGAGYSNEGFSVGWMTRLNGIELGSILFGATQAEKELFYSWSPELLAFCSQDIYEPILANCARQIPSVELLLSSLATGITQDEKRVMVEYSTDGSKRTVRARYVIGADGVRSPTRKWLGITETGITSLGNSINVLFNAPMEPYRAGRGYGLFWIVNGDTQGAFAWRNRGDLWSYNFEAAPNEDPKSYTPERCAEVVRTAAGVPDLPVDVISILHWQHDQAVTDRWRSGRVFLAGDACHRFPPHGGFGMNSGVQDSQNLVWKIIARLRWGAGDSLLDSYEAERKPVAQHNGDQMILNTKRMAETGFLLKDPKALAAIETPDGEPLRQKITAAIPKQREQFFSQGQQFGQIYDSAAVVKDASPRIESTISEYRPTGYPGARAPHVWLINAQGTAFSSIDLYNGGFILFAGVDGQSWTAAAERLAKLMPTVPLSSFVIGASGYVQRAGDTKWEALVGVGPTGALLVRPDGHVGARWAALPNDAATVLKDALGSILAAAAAVPANR